MDGQLLLALVVASGAISFTIIVQLIGFLTCISLARPNLRSSHQEATPQGGGVGIVAATLLIAGAGSWLSGALTDEFAILGIAVLGLTAIGAADDIRPLSVGVRLVAQVLCIGLVVFHTFDELTLWTGLVFIEGALILLTILGLWFVNLTNFMDGLDWLTVAAVTPIAATISLLGLTENFSVEVAILSCALLGSLLGFSPFNRPPARLFLGDVGALSIGLMVFWMLLKLALVGGVVSAIIFPLYYLADATLTLARRFLSGETFWQAHRSHFYQRGHGSGMSALSVAAYIFTVNCALAGLAAFSFFQDEITNQLLALAVALGLVAVLLWKFSSYSSPSGTIVQ
jgi:UDP-N-acetylmuramyl pentapeptide phosphotransferase/UDP-N-acetylglucosamine-1-phosphate transferase